MRPKWRIVVGRSSGDQLKGFSGYRAWSTVFAVENLETLELSGWVDNTSWLRSDAWHDLAFEARRVGVSASAQRLRNARGKATARFGNDHPPERCRSCWSGDGASPRGKHHPLLHARTPPWAVAGGMTPDPRRADDAVLAHIYPDGSYELLDD